MCHMEHMCHITDLSHVTPLPQMIERRYVRREHHVGVALLHRMI